VVGYDYNGVIALAVAAWAAAFFSLYSAGIHSKLIRNAHNAPVGVYHFYGLDSDKGWSQSELRNSYDKLLEVPDEDKYRVRPSSPSGLEIKAFLAQAMPFIKSESFPKWLKDSFPDACEIIEKTILAFENAEIVVDCISGAQGLTDPTVRGLSHRLSGKTHSLLLCDTRTSLQTQAGRTAFCKL
jgi:hypothetical protein